METDRLRAPEAFLTDVQRNRMMNPHDYPNYMMELFEVFRGTLREN